MQKTKSSDPIESVIGILFSPNRSHVLLIQRRDVPVWTLPGGGIEPHETPEEAVVREMLEETGLHVKIKRLVGAYTPLNRLAKHTHLYECEQITGVLTTSSETKNLAFFPLDALPPLIPPPFLDWIADAVCLGPTLYKALHSVTYARLIKNMFLHPVLVIRFVLARLGLSIND